MPASGGYGRSASMPASGPGACFARSSRSAGRPQRLGAVCQELVRHEPLVGAVLVERGDRRLGIRIARRRAVLAQEREDLVLGPGVGLGLAQLVGELGPQQAPLARHRGDGAREAARPAEPLRRAHRRPVANARGVRGRPRPARSREPACWSARRIAHARTSAPTATTLPGKYPRANGGAEHETPHPDRSPSARTPPAPDRAVALRHAAAAGPRLGAGRLRQDDAAERVAGAVHRPCRVAVTGRGRQRRASLPHSPCGVVGSAGDRSAERSGHDEPRQPPRRAARRDRSRARRLPRDRHARDPRGGVVPGRAPAGDGERRDRLALGPAARRWRDCEAAASCSSCASPTSASPSTRRTCSSTG